MQTLRQAASKRNLVGEAWPKIEGLDELYMNGFVPRAGQFGMIMGRPGAQKSGLALWLASQIGWSTLYVSADMSPSSVVMRLGSQVLGRPVRPSKDGDPFDSLSDAERSKLDVLKNVKFAFNSLITWNGIFDALAAHVAMHGKYPRLMFIDNLQNFEGCDSEYAGQSQAMGDLRALAAETGIGVIVLHHASDGQASEDTRIPPARRNMKNKVSERPEWVLSIAVGDEKDGILPSYVAIVKQRDGKCHPDGLTCARTFINPELSRFYRNVGIALKDAGSSREGGNS